MTADVLARRSGSSTQAPEDDDVMAGWIAFAIFSAC